MSCSIKHGMITLESLWTRRKVKEARQLEMEYYDRMHVFDQVPFAQCWERTGKATKARDIEEDG